MKVPLHELNLEKEEDRIEADKCLHIMRSIVRNRKEIEFIATLTRDVNSVLVYFKRFDQLMGNIRVVDAHGKSGSLYFFANLNIISRVAQHAYKVIAITKGETKDRMRQFGYLLLGIRTKYIIRRICRGWSRRSIRKYRDPIPLSLNQLHYRKKVEELREVENECNIQNPEGSIRNN